MWDLSLIQSYTIVSTMLSKCKQIKTRQFRNFRKRLLTMVNYNFVMRLFNKS